MRGKLLVLLAYVNNSQKITQVVELLTKSGHANLQEVYMDGTKIEANANRYRFVWGKAIRTNRAKM